MKKLKYTMLNLMHFSIRLLSIILANVVGTKIWHLVHSRQIELFGKFEAKYLLNFEATGLYASNNYRVYVLVLLLLLCYTFFGFIYFTATFIKRQYCIMCRDCGYCEKFLSCRSKVVVWLTKDRPYK